jgi:hypothetical protein
MLTPQRRHDHWRVNKRLNDKLRAITRWQSDPGYEWHNVPGKGRYWKRQLHKAERRAWKAEVAGRRPRRIGGYRSTVNWRAT